MADGRKSAPNENFYATAALRSHHYIIYYLRLLTTNAYNLVNQARALRIGEIINDFREIQHRIAAIQAQPSREEFNEDGFVLLRQVQAEAKALLSMPFQPSARGRGTEEHHKVQLKR
jgi:hypothetical protein